ncbi:MAG: FAD-dependent oxidoreductase [Actinomycetota bacterium]|nr:FAD-dependent oxidoreductase [Actinomycetota bacterium]
MDPRHAILFEPVRIGPKTLPNRFYQVPHASGFGSARPRAQAAFRGIKAEGGWGGVCVEYAAVSADSDEIPAISADLWDDADGEALALTAAAVHAHGALAGLELFHGGAASANGSSRGVRLAPSQLGSEAQWGGLAAEMTTDDIARVRRDWVTAARRAADAGFDIVYVYGAHGYLMSQFISPITNRRTDGYGGSLANRGRFWLETLAAVRDAVGDRCAIATRMSVHGRRGLPGIETDEMLGLVAMASDLVDLFDLTVGSWPEDSGSSRFYPEGHQRDWTHRFREATSKPIVAVGRYTSPDLMARVIASGAVDLIGSARQAIADPFLPAKVRAGRLDEIRECSGSNLCILREETFNQIGCAQNATAGEEYRRGWHPEILPAATNSGQPVLIVGAGPAGLECAVTLGRRGFGQVHLVEAGPEIGGRLTWIRRLPTLGDWGRIVDYRAVQLARLPGIEVITGRRLTAAEILDYGAPIVVLATGSTWRGDGAQPGHPDPMPGADQAGPRVLTPEQVAAGRRPPGPRVVVYDADGYFMGSALADLLAREESRVTVVTPFPVLSPVSDATLEGEALREHVHRSGIDVVHATTVTAIEAVHGGPVTLTGTDRYGETWSVVCDGVVLVTMQVSNDVLHAELTADRAALAAAGISLYRIGDALAPRLISEAVYDGHRLAMEIDGPDPAVPAAYRRERAGR